MSCRVRAAFGAGFAAQWSGLRGIDADQHLRVFLDRPAASRLAERFRLQFRGELFNSFNHPNFGIPGTTMDSANFGSIITAADARVVQAGFKMYF